ncbi:hypothetical protein TWF718_001891 [Orbilia javanica]|uniref:NB-ARC domain-containing protein n=1 Tax=Orbilia javanica TaxID=47235 RepID=A0AAN8RNR7_9PEZI
MNDINPESEVRGSSHTFNNENCRIPFQIGQTGNIDQFYCQINNYPTHIPSSSSADARAVEIKEINCKIPLNLPFPKNQKFTGREKELAIIDQYFTESVPRYAPTICALVGTGGMGKTQVALEYAYRKGTHFTAIFWISIATEEDVQASIVKAMQQIIEEQARVSQLEPSNYKALATALGIPGLIDGKGKISSSQESIGEIQAAFLHWLGLSGNDSWLLIVDNADDLESFTIDEYFPRHGGGAVLITSRRREFSHCAREVGLDGLDRNNAVELLLRLVQLSDPTEGDMEHAMAVVENLGFMPLAISHAGCFIRELDIPMSEYLEYYNKAFTTVQSRKPTLGWSYREDTAVTTWEVSFSSVRKRDEKAALLLLSCAYLNSNEIDADMFEDEELDATAKLQNKERISLLAKYSLINQQHGNAFSIHPVVHTWARERLDHSGQLSAMASTLNIIGRTLKQDQLTFFFEGRNIQRAITVIAHIEMFFKYSDSKFDELFESRLCSMSGALSTIRDMTIVLYRQFKHEEAMKWTRRVVTKSQSVLGKDSLDTLAAMDILSEILSALGIYDEALILSKEALASKEKLAGKDSVPTLDAVSRIGEILLQQGKIEEAMGWHQRALAGKQSGLGENHPATLYETQRIALNLRSQGKYDEALELLQKSLASMEKALAGSDPRIGIGSDVAIRIFDIWNDIGTVFAKKRNSDEAMSWLLRALDGREKVLGKEHLLTANTVMVIGRVLCTQGEYDRALQWFQRALATYEGVIKNDYMAKVTIARIGYLFFEQGKYDESIAWSQRVVDSCKNGFQRKRDIGFSASNVIGHNYHAKGKYDEALIWYRRALVGYQELYGEDHPRTISTYKLIESTLLRQTDALKAPTQGYGLWPASYSRMAKRSCIVS